MTIKTIAEQGWYLHNDFLGAPFGLDAYDLPTPDGLSLILLKFMLLFLDSATTLNLFFLGTFPLVAITSFWVFTSFKISKSISRVAALLYTFLPYHFLRGVEHVFLAAYYTIPPATSVILWLWSDELPFFSKNQDCKEKNKVDFLNSKAILSALICLVLGSTGVYYAFFACFFIVIASISAFLYKKEKRVFLSAIILIAIISSSLLINLLPSLVYSYQNGVNEQVAHRVSSDSEVLGLKIIYLLFPIGNHRLPFLRDLMNKYLEPNPPLHNENSFAALGIVGSIGLISLLFRAVFSSIYKEKNSSFCIYDRLSVLNISAILFATIGGFSSIFAVLVSPQIRAGNRISIFIAFFSLLTVALFVDALRKKYINTTSKKILFNALLVLVLILGILDQTSPVFIPNYSARQEEYINERGFVHTIERLLPADSMVFQLPYVPFPENPPVNKMADYDLFRGYIHSKKLRWSYGAMRGRDSGWYQNISEKPLDILLQKISLVGFKGIYLDRYGYSDSGQELERALENKLGTKAVVSENGRLAFFNMNLLNEELRNRYTPEQIKSYKRLILNQKFLNINVVWEKGFYNLEQNLNEGEWRWSEEQGILILNNPNKKTIQTKISMALATGQPDYSNLQIESRLFSEVIKINNKPSVFEKRIIIPPGRYKIKFSSDAKQVNISQDSRHLFFRVFNFKAEEESRNEKELINKFEDDKLENLKPTQLEWRSGFYEAENILGEKWRWSENQSTLIVNNPTKKSRKTKISMALATGQPNYSKLQIESELFSEVIEINNKPLVFEKTITMPPGKHIIKFSSDAKQVDTAQNSRQLFFRISDVIL